VTFEPGTATLTPEGDAQATRLAAFLEQLPDVRMSLTPVVSARDVEAIGPKVKDSQIADLGTRRLEAVKATLEQAGVDGKRLTEVKVVQREGRDGQVQADVLEPETPQPSKVREVLERLKIVRSK
jgi:hypothetical protein